MATENAAFYGTQYYEEIAAARAKIEHDIEAYHGSIPDDDFKPIIYHTSRIKSPNSLKAKLRKRGLEETYEAAVNGGVDDIIGFRIVCAFTDDVFAVKEFFASHGDYEIVNVSNYIQEPKESGYRSLHLAIKIIDGAGFPMAKGMIAEIQIRTIAQDTWANVEHKLKYKKELGADGELFAKELKRCAEKTAALDFELSAIRDAIYDGIS